MAMAVPRSPTSSPSDFNFNNIASAPSSPKPFGNPNEYFYFYSSAPSSPNNATAIYSYFETTDEDLEEMPISPKLRNDFEFCLDGPSKLSLTDKLFDEGQIRPSRLSEPSRRQEKKTCSDTMKDSIVSSRSRRDQARSLAPMRGDEGPASSPSTSTSAPSVKRHGSRKWRLKDLLLFRSSSEGRVTGRGSKDPLRKYSLLPSSSSSSLLISPSNNKKKEGDGSTKRGTKPVVSVHELHYTENRAASEEMKKRTPLPYHRNSFFGCLHMNPAVRSLTRGFNNSSSFSWGRSS